MHSSHFFTIIQCSFVAMMSIGYIQLTLYEEVLDKSNVVSICNGVQDMYFMYFISDMNFVFLSIHPEQFPHSSLRVIIQAHDRTEICNTRTQKLQSVIFWFCKR